MRQTKTVTVLQFTMIAIGVAIAVWLHFKAHPNAEVTHPNVRLHALKHTGQPLEPQAEATQFDRQPLPQKPPAGKPRRQLQEPKAQATKVHRPLLDLKAQPSAVYRQRFEPRVQVSDAPAAPQATQPPTHAAQPAPATQPAPGQPAQSAQMAQPAQPAQLAQATHTEPTQTAEAVQATRATEVVQGSRVDRRQSWQYINMGRQSFHEHKFDNAAALYEKALTADPDNSYGWRLMGYALFRAGRIQESIDANERAVDLNPADPLNYIVLAKSYCAARRYGDAERALRNQPPFEVAHPVISYARSDGEIRRVCGPIVASWNAR